MYKITLAIGTPEGKNPDGKIVKGSYDKKVLNLTFETEQDAGLHLMRLAHNPMEQVDYEIIKIQNS